MPLVFFIVYKNAEHKDVIRTLTETNISDTTNIYDIDYFKSCSFARPLQNGSFHVFTPIGGSNQDYDFVDLDYVMSGTPYLDDDSIVTVDQWIQNHINTKSIYESLYQLVVQTILNEIDRDNDSITWH